MPRFIPIVAVLRIPGFPHPRPRRVLLVSAWIFLAAAALSLATTTTAGTVALAGETGQGPEKDPGEEAEPEKAAVEIALETTWLLPRRTWTVKGFFDLAEGFLGHKGAHIGWGAARFRILEDAGDLLSREVVIELRRVPLQRAVEQIGRQLDLRYAIDREANEVLFSRRKGTAPPPAPARRMLPPGSAPSWRPLPHEQTDEDREALREILDALKEVKRDRRRLFREGEKLFRKLGDVRTRESLRALERFARRYRSSTEYLGAIAESMGRIDGTEAAEALVDLTARSGERWAKVTCRRGLATLRTEAAARVLAEKGLGHRKKHVRLEAARALAGLGWSGSVEALAEAAGASCEETARWASKALGRIPHADAVARLLEILTDPSRPDSARVAGFHELMDTAPENPGLLEAARAAVDEGGSAAVLVSALHVLRNRGDADSAERVIPLLSHETWQVRYAAVRALAAMRRASALGPLIGRLEEEEGKIRHEIGLALLEFTGRYFGDDPALWEEWWEARKDTYAVSPIQKPKRKAHTTAVEATYHKIPVISHRVVFLLDVSDSMGARLGFGGGPGRGPRGGTYYAFCKRELLRTLEKLERGVLFNIITFESEVDAWRRDLVPVSERSRREARKFLDGRRPHGSTNFFEALKFAFREPRADTLYVLSDGQPKEDKDEILEWVRETNRTRLLTIHTISTGATWTPFMKKLAEQNGGRYVGLE